jgi:hypothetical protein
MSRKLSAQHVTYGSLSHMLIDSNRLAVFTPNSFGVGSNIVGSGPDERPVGSEVPEPATLMLLGLALAVLVKQRQRSR